MVSTSDFESDSSSSSLDAKTVKLYQLDWLMDCESVKGVRIPASPKLRMWWKWHYTTALDTVP